MQFIVWHFCCLPGNLDRETHQSGLRGKQEQTLSWMVCRWNTSSMTYIYIYMWNEGPSLTSLKVVYVLWNSHRFIPIQQRETNFHLCVFDFCVFWIRRHVFHRLSPQNWNHWESRILHLGGFVKHISMHTCFQHDFRIQHDSTASSSRWEFGNQVP